MRQMLTGTLIALLAAAAGIAPPARAADKPLDSARDKPNFVVILADDLGDG